MCFLLCVFAAARLVVLEKEGSANNGKKVKSTSVLYQHVCLESFANDVKLFRRHG